MDDLHAYDIIKLNEMLGQSVEITYLQIIKKNNNPYTIYSFKIDNTNSQRISMEYQYQTITINDYGNSQNNGMWLDQNANRSQVEIWRSNKWIFIFLNIVMLMIQQLHVFEIVHNVVWSMIDYYQSWVGIVTDKLCGFVWGAL